MSEERQVILTPDIDAMLIEIMDNLNLKTRPAAIRIACSKLLESINRKDPDWAREDVDGPDTFRLGPDGKLHPVEYNESDRV